MVGMRRRRGRRNAAAPWAVVAAAVLLTGCAGAEKRDVGSSQDCPHRDAYCPADGPGVAWPGRPADSPSGRFQLRVLRESSAKAGEDWLFEVVDKATGAVVLDPTPAADGGLGLVVAWDPSQPETVWASRPIASRWRPDRAGSPWVKHIAGPGDVLPPVVAATIASDPG